MFVIVRSISERVTTPGEATAGVELYGLIVQHIARDRTSWPN